MGIIQSVDRKVDRGPECPPIFTSTFEKYRELKFIQREDDDRIVIYPRDMLKWPDLMAYSAVTGQTISASEAKLIMNLDAIFEGREDG